MTINIVVQAGADRLPPLYKVSFEDEQFDT